MKLIPKIIQYLILFIFYLYFIYLYEYKKYCIINITSSMYIILSLYVHTSINKKVRFNKI